MTSITLESTKDLGVKPRDAERSKNFFALGLLSWMYTRPIDPIVEWINERFGSKPTVRDANLAAFKAGYHFGETAELFDHPWEVLPARPAGGALSQHHRQRRPRLRPDRGVAEQQAADRLRVVPDHAGVGHPPRALAAQELRCSHAAGRGRDRRGRRGGRRRLRRAPRHHRDQRPGHGPEGRDAWGSRSASSCRSSSSTCSGAARRRGCPTKTEQSDLLLAMYGRHGEAPMPVVAPRSPSHCFEAAFEAARIALKYRTPVILLTDGYLANGSEPWFLPDVEALPDIGVPFADSPNHDGDFWPYLRDPETLARPWAIPGTPGLMHRIGGLEKEDGTGNVNYDPENHEHMVRIRAEKVARIASDIPPVEVDDAGRRRAARARMGEHVGVDPGRGATRARRRQAGRPRAPRAHEPVPRESRRGAGGLSEDPRARDEPRAAVPPRARRVPRRRARR